MRVRGVGAVALLEEKARPFRIPADVGAVGNDGIGQGEGAAKRQIAADVVIDSRLCGGAGSYRYVVTLLSPDGRVMRVTFDAQSGAVIAVK